MVRQRLFPLPAFSLKPSTDVLLTLVLILGYLAAIRAMSLVESRLTSIEESLQTLTYAVARK